MSREAIKQSKRRQDSLYSDQDCPQRSYFKLVYTPPNKSNYKTTPPNQQTLLFPLPSSALCKMRFFSLKSFTKASRESPMPSSGSGVEAFSGILMLLATATFHSLVSPPSLPTGQTTVTAQRVIIPPTPTPTTPMNLTPTKTILTSTSFSTTDSPYSSGLFKVIGIFGIAATLAGTVTLIRHTSSIAENSSETVPSGYGSGSADNEDSTSDDNSEESGYESDEDASSQDEDASEDEDYDSDTTDGDNDSDPDDTEPESDDEPAGDDDTVEGCGSADPEEPPPPPPHSTTASPDDDIPGPPKFYNRLTIFFMFVVACASAFEEYLQRRKSRCTRGKAAQQETRARNITAPPESGLCMVANTTTTTTITTTTDTAISSAREETDAAVTKSIVLWVKPATDLIPWIAPYTPWLAEKILAQITPASILIPAPVEANVSPVALSDQTTSIMMAATATIAPAAAQYAASIYDRIRNPSLMDVYWCAIAVFVSIYAVALFTTKWEINTHKDPNVCREVLEPRTEEKVTKKKKKAKKNKKKKAKKSKQQRTEEVENGEAHEEAINMTEENGIEVEGEVNKEVEQEEGQIEESSEIDMTEEIKAEGEKEAVEQEAVEQEEERRPRNEQVEEIAEVEEDEVEGMKGDTDTDDATSDVDEFADALDEIITNLSASGDVEEPTAIVDAIVLDTEAEVTNMPVESEGATKETEKPVEVLEADETIETLPRKQLKDGEEDLSSNSVMASEPEAGPEQSSSTKSEAEAEPQPGWHVVTRKSRRQKREVAPETAPQPGPSTASNKEAKTSREQHNKKALESWKAFQEEKVRKEAEEQKAAEAKKAKGKGKRGISSFDMVMEAIREQRAALIVELKSDKKEPSCAPLSPSTSVPSKQSEIQKASEASITQPTSVPTSASSKLPNNPLNWATIAGRPAGSDNAVVIMPTLSVQVKKSEANKDLNKVASS
ncbi:hypothetical protein C0995_002180 [Termitomyces sp. Mi166|nr:hypothetical protein C0995_002180 [Termitomyces sp. Mi166\